MRNITTLIIGALALISLTGCISQRALNCDLSRIPQNNLAFVAKNSAQQQLVSKSAANKLRANYLKKFYSPWTQPFAWQSKTLIKNNIVNTINTFIHHPGWDANQNLHQITWAKNIYRNLNLDNYPNAHARAITVRTATLHVLPTDSPSFSDWYAAGEGYPFDNLQTAYLSANTPLYILHTTLDKQWDLVITPYQCCGWVKSLDLASVDAKFISKWQQHHYIVALQDGKSIFDLQQHYRESTQIGAIFPRLKTTAQYYQILTAISNTHGKAQLIVARVARNAAQTWPLKLTQTNIASLANHFLGNPYGWGDLYNYRDCSETMRSLFAPFAIWLPRNSEAQMQTGKFISLANFNNQQKQQLIIKLGKPFTTLLWMPGHIMLYIGEKNGKVYAFHQPWGLRTVNYFGKSGRAVIGRTVITTLDIGKKYINTKGTYLDSIEGMSMMATAEKLFKH